MQLVTVYRHKVTTTLKSRVKRLSICTSIFSKRWTTCKQKELPTSVLFFECYVSLSAPARRRSLDFQITTRTRNAKAVEQLLRLTGPSIIKCYLSLKSKQITSYTIASQAHRLTSFKPYT